MTPLEKAIKTAIDMISSYLSIDLALVALIPSFGCEPKAAVLSRAFSYRVSGAPLGASFGPLGGLLRPVLDLLGAF